VPNAGSPNSTCDSSTQLFLIQKNVFNAINQQNMLAIPESAIIGRENGKIVFAIDNGESGNFLFV